MKVLVAESDDFSQEVISILSKRFDLKVSNNLSQKKFEEAFLEYDIIWFRLKYNLLNIDNNKNIRCKFLVCPVTGINHISKVFLEKNEIRLISLKGEKSFLKEITPTAEHTIFLTLALMRNAIRSIDDVKKGNWNRDIFRGNELKNKRVGIIGYGRLGKMTANIFSAFNCDLTVFDPYFHIEDEIPYRKAKRIEDIFKFNDVISIHVDLNSTTNKFIDARILKYCKDAFLINTSRGEVLNEVDVIKAIEDENLKGFAADVINNEAIDYKESELFKYNLISESNIILTPHIGGNTYESFEKTEKFVLDKLLNLINK